MSMKHWLNDPDKGKHNAQTQASRIVIFPT